MAETARLRLPEIAAAQAQKHVTHNEALVALDTLVQLSVLDKDLTSPPGSPAEGDCYIVAAGASGDWTGWDDRIARYEDGQWRSYLPGAGSGLGWMAFVQDEAVMYVRTGSGWAPVSAGMLGFSIDTWTPGITFATPGDLSVSYTAFRFGYYVDIASQLLLAMFSFQFTPTYTTASGNLQMTGLPSFPNSGSGFTCSFRAAGGSNMPTFPSGTTGVVAITAGADNLTVYGVGSGSNSAFTTSQITSGVSRWLLGFGALSL